MLILVAFLVFGGVFYAAYSIAVLIDQRRGPAQEELVAQIRAFRTANLAYPGSGPPQEQSAAGGAGDERVVPRLETFRRLLLGGLEHRLARRGAGQLIEARLRRAGLRLRASEFLAMRAMWAFVPALGVLAGTRNAWLALAAAAGGFWVPEMLVLRATRMRLRRLTRQLPDALTLIANSLRSGHSFLQAVDVAAGEVGDPLGAELQQLVKETRVDIAIEDALANFFHRMPTPDVQLVVTAVIIQRQVGGNLAELLEQVSDTIRQRMRIEGELRSLTAQGRLSGWIVGLLPLAIGGFIAVVNPGYLSLLFTEPLGRAMAGVGVGMQLIGALVIRRMVQLQV